MTQTTRQPVPELTAVWWLDDITDDNQANDRFEAHPTPATATATGPATATTSRLLARLSQRLVLTYTSHGDVVVDLHVGTHPRPASTDTGRTYLHLADRAAITDLDRRTALTSLVLASAPISATFARVSDLFLACRLIMTADTATLALLGTPVDDGAASISQRHQWEAAATHAGLRPAGTVLALHNPGHGDRYLYSATNKQVQGLLAMQPPVPALPIGVALFTTSTDGHGQER